jgi:hypothetical protein
LKPQRFQESRWEIVTGFWESWFIATEDSTRTQSRCSWNLGEPWLGSKPIVVYSVFSRGNKFTFH